MPTQAELMSLNQIDFTKKPVDLELFLAKPDKTIIAKLSEAFNKSMTLKLGNVNEISFTLPFDVDINRRLTRNPNVDLLKDRYLIKAKLDTKEEWYIINSITSTMEDSDAMDVVCYLLPYEMSGKNIRSFNRLSINLTTALSGGTTTDVETGQPVAVTGLLNNTRWTLGYVDASFDTKYRAFDLTSTTVLDAVFQVADTFNALIIWDTFNRKINFYNPENYGVNRGLTLNYGHYMQSLSRESKSDEMVTRLKCFGKEGLSIQGVNITGQNYIEDYSFFLYPFQRDESRQVLQRSYYMSDELCHAILDYSDYLNSKEGAYRTFVAQMKENQELWTTKTDELSTLQEQMNQIQNTLDLANSRGDTAAANAAIANKNAKQIEINSKKSQVDEIEFAMENIDTQIQNLRSTMAYSAFFNKELLEELNDFVIEKEFSDETYVDAQALYDEAKKQFESMKMPQVVITIDADNFLQVVESQRDWGKLNLGDIINIRYEKMGVNSTAKIIEYTVNFEEGSISLTIANTKDIMTDEEKLIKMLYSSNAASTALNINKSIWDSAGATKSTVEAYIDNLLDATKQGIVAGVNNSVNISERGILIKDSSDPNTYLVIQNGVLAITRDNGNTWSHAITKDGIIGERIFGKILAGAKLTIDATDNNGQRLFMVDGNGVTIAGGALTVTGGIPAEQLDPDILIGIDGDISAVQQSLDTLGTNVNNMMSDSMITSIEANMLEINLSQVTSESTDLVNTATSLSITTEKTNYSSALTALTTELNKWINKSNYPINITATDRNNIQTKFNTLQSAKSVLINKITAVRQALSQSYTDGQVAELNGTLDDLQLDFDNFSSDNVITLAEANALKLSLNQVTSESTDIVNVATTLSITTEKTNYSTALSTLTTEVNKWVGKTGYPLAITSTDRANIKSKFEDLQTKKSILINKIASTREATAKAYTDTQVTELSTALDTMESDVDKFTSDSYITNIEANSLKLSLNQVTSESTDIVTIANNLGITTERTNYSTSLATLTTEVNKWIDKLTYPIAITTTDRTNIKTKFEDLQSKKSILANKITAVRQANSQTYTDQQVDEVTNALTDLQGDVDAFSTDNIITKAEANSLKLSLSQVTSESADIVSIANTLGITTERTNYSTSLTTLTTEINKWIDKTYPLAITTTDRTNIKTKFEDLQSKKSILINKIAATREQRAKDASLGLGTAYNGVVVDSTNGLVITKSDISVRTVLNATSGFRFQKNTGTTGSPTWTDMLSYDTTSGNLSVDGIINARDLKVNGTSVMTVDGKIKALAVETLTVGVNVSMGANATISWSQVTNQPSIPTVPSYITSTKITSTSIESPNISGGTIVIGSGNNVFKADSNGVYLGNATFASAPFKVSMDGKLTALDGTFTGVVNGSTVRSRASATSGAGVELLSNYGDIKAYNASGTLIFQLYDEIDGGVILSNPSGGRFGLGRANGYTQALGQWDFSTASITGLVATFG